MRVPFHASTLNRATIFGVPRVLRHFLPACILAVSSLASIETVCDPGLPEREPFPKYVTAFRRPRLRGLGPASTALFWKWLRVTPSRTPDC